MNQVKRVAIKLSSKAETIVKKGHPWIFSESIVKCPADAATGDVAIIFSAKDNKLMAVGLYDAASPIRVKVLSLQQPIVPNTAFFRQRIQAAYERRRSFMAAHTNAFRLIYGEGDHLPGVIVDVYDKVVVLKLYSGMWEPYVNDIVAALADLLQPEAIVLRLSRAAAKVMKAYGDASVLYGTLANPVVRFKEFGVYFQANILLGHKTGYFLDHRANRHQVGLMAKGKTVLDVFAYAGGFSVHALVGGAKMVTSVDLSNQALALAEQNAALNQYPGKLKTVAGDAFEILNNMIEERQQYDIVVIDPPSFAKQQSEVPVAIKRYEQLAVLGAKLCRKSGMLILASCSSRVSLEDLLQAHRNAFAKLGLKPVLFQTTTHDWDHPAGIPELSYLKTAYYRM